MIAVGAGLLSVNTENMSNVIRNTNCEKRIVPAVTILHFIQKAST